MDQTTNHGSGLGPGNDRDYCAWVGFWLPFGVLAVLAILGAIVAGTGGRPGDYACGMILLVGAVLLGFLRLKTQLDGAPAGWGSFILVDRMADLIVMIPLFAIIGLAGLFTAKAWEAGTMHYAGIALFVVSGLIIFLNLKRVFDRLDVER